MVLDLGNDPSGAVPGRGLIVEAPVSHQWGVAGSAAGPGEQVLDLPHQDLIGWHADGVPHLPAFQRLVDRREGKRRVGADNDGVPLTPEWLNTNSG